MNWLLIILGALVIIQTWRVSKLKRAVALYYPWYAIRFPPKRISQEWGGATLYVHRGEWDMFGYQPMEDPEGEPPDSLGVMG